MSQFEVVLFFKNFPTTRKQDDFGAIVELIS
jgi:hypothetical protein